MDYFLIAEVINNFEKMLFDIQNYVLKEIFDLLKVELFISRKRYKRLVSY
jgi:hypothetical protein